MIFDIQWLVFTPDIGTYRKRGDKMCLQRFTGNLWLDSNGLGYV